jgi:hypothetical protein
MTTLRWLVRASGRPQQPLAFQYDTDVCDYWAPAFADMTGRPLSHLINGAPTTRADRVSRRHEAA